MEGQPGDVDPSRLRISDADRHTVSEVLRQAAGEGRIDLDELDARLEATYVAKTYGELVPITADLPLAGRPAPVPAPTSGRPVPRPAGPLPRHASSVAVMSETRRVGDWLVQEHHTAFALMGSVVLDLREAHFDTGEVVIDASAVMGEVRIVVGAGVRVSVEGFGVMGEFTEQRPRVPFDPALGGPLVRVRGLALMGSVHVQRKGPPGPPLRRSLQR
jgi:hypothetical protein